LGRPRQFRQRGFEEPIDLIAQTGQLPKTGPSAQLWSLPPSQTIHNFPFFDVYTENHKLIVASAVPNIML
jgi:hypothetical protein